MHKSYLIEVKKGMVVTVCKNSRLCVNAVITNMNTTQSCIKHYQTYQTFGAETLVSKRQRSSSNSRLTVP